MSTKKTNTRRYWRNLSALDMAAIKQLTGGDGVARNLGASQCEIDEDEDEDEDEEGGEA